MDSILTMIDDAIANVKRSGGIQIDIGGEERYPNAVNLNPSEVGTLGSQIPNLILGIGEQLPFRATSVDLITLENTPIRPGTSEEMVRVIKPEGHIILFSPTVYAVAGGAHQQVIDAVGGHAEQTHHADGMTTTIIVAPR